MTTDQQILNEIQYALLETPNNGASMSSQLWTIAEVIDALNKAQQIFMKDTGLLLDHAALVTTPNVFRQPMPENWIIIHRVSWATYAGVFTALGRADSYEADAGITNWATTTAARPQIYMDAELPTLEIQIAPASYNGGILHVLYVAEPDQVSNTGVLMTVVDEFIPYVKWKTLSILLTKIGRAADPARADYCNQRYNEGVAVARTLLKSWKA